MRRKRLLKNANTSLQAFAATLTTSFEMCDCCGLKKIHNVPEFRTYQEVSAMLLKIQKWMDSENYVKGRESESVSIRE